MQEYYGIVKDPSNRGFRLLKRTMPHHKGMFLEVDGKFSDFIPHDSKIKVCKTTRELIGVLKSKVKGLKKIPVPHGNNCDIMAFSV